jgi:23S rRNA (adenine2503-C2)-methyltransferase
VPSLRTIERGAHELQWAVMHATRGRKPAATRTDLKGLTLAEFEAFVTGLGEPRYRANQVAAWVFPRDVHEFAGMTDLSLPLRERLTQEATVTTSVVVTSRQSAADGTRKLLLEYADAGRVEAVVLHDEERATGCVSTQIGCRFGCSFCATGNMGFVRNLTAGEIVEQIQALRRLITPERIDNIVLMGMGEPLDNYDATMKAVRIANAPWGLGIGARKITVSTAGIIPGILRLADEALQVNLAVSLNAPTQKLRAQLMPVAEAHPLEPLMDALREYAKKTGRTVTLEYVLLREINDSPEAADALGRLARSLMCKVNLIGYNENSKSAFSSPPDKTVDAFAARLRKRCPNVVRRVGRGADISAGCGQLCVGTPPPPRARKDPKTPKSRRRASR